MSFYDNIFIDVVIVLFPIFVYLLYTAYKTNSTSISRNKMYYIVNFAIVYLLYRYKPYCDDIIFLAFINIPIMLAFLKKENDLAIFLTFLVTLQISYLYSIPLYYIILEYIIYFIIYNYFYCKNNYYEKFFMYFLFIKGTIMSYFMFYVFETDLSDYELVVRIFITLLLFYSVTTIAVTLLKKGEEIISLNKSLKEFEHAKKVGNCLFRITHEIKNPLAVCQGYLDMIDYNHMQKVRKYIEIIKEEIHRSLTILNDFSDYTKVKVIPEIMDINVLIEDVAESIKPLLNSNNIELVTNLKDEEVYIDGDYNKLKQVFINLIKNSKEAISRNGIIKIDETVQGKNIYINVKDNGCGMDKLEKEKCGELFFTTKEHGTGMGVSMSKEIIKLHKGTLSYESAKDKGTKATITLQKMNIKD